MSYVVTFQVVNPSDTAKVEDAIYDIDGKIVDSKSGRIVFQADPETVTVLASVPGLKITEKRVFNWKRTFR